MFMSKQTSIVWIPEKILGKMLEEARAKLPDETGGVILGYWNKQFDEAVVTNVTGPGPMAIHEPYSFTPDKEYQDAEIEKHYEESDMLHTYMGDWHTHPGGKVALSSTDRRTLRRIATYKKARLPIPLMAILGGVSDWTLKFWCYKSTYLGTLGIKIKAKELKIKFY